MKKVAYLIVEWPLTLEALQHVCSVIASYAGEDSHIRPTNGKRIRVELDITHFTEDEKEIEKTLEAMKIELLTMPVMVLGVDYAEEPED